MTQQNIDLASLTTSQGFSIFGAAANDWSGYSVSNAGDVNNDGYDDIIIGSPFADPNSRFNAGTSYVIYGGSTTSNTNVDLLNLGNRGFAIFGAGGSGWPASGWSVSSAGDINNDGFSDVILGAPSESPSSRAYAGTSYVIYGNSTASNTNIDLLNLGSRGFAIYGGTANDYSGRSVSNAGDVNNDGYDDIIIGSPLAEPSSRNEAGTSYVIYGNSTASNTNIDLLNLGSRGFAIYGAAINDQSGISVSNAGDINNDGYDDIIIGASYATTSSREYAGTSYVIYGGNTASNTNIDLLSLGNRGFAIFGAATQDNSGTSVSNAGDVNNDGYDDIIIGSPFADPSSRDDAGISYVIYGGNTASNTNIDLLNLRNRGFAIFGAATQDNSGTSVSNVGDVNNDGYDDIIIGSPLADPSSRDAAGTSYVIYGRSTIGNTNIDLLNLGSRGFSIFGATAVDKSGISVSNVGDVNNDGYQDIIIGAFLANPSSKEDAGTSYVIYGVALPTVIPTTTPTVIPTVTPTVIPTASHTMLPTYIPSSLEQTTSTTSTELSQGAIIGIAIGGAVLGIGGYTLIVYSCHLWPFNSFNSVPTDDVEKKVVDNIQKTIPANIELGGALQLVEEGVLI